MNKKALITGITGQDGPYLKGIPVDGQHSIQHYGYDIEDKLSHMLSEELAKSIDAQILQKIINLGRPMSRADKIKSIIDKIKSSE